MWAVDGSALESVDGHGDPALRGGDRAMQTTQPRDLGALALVVGVFVILLIVSIVVGPTR
jgi:hypothetical protein